ncbi:MAG: 1-(5-phosphoribosyl)-5-((5-phosphoribosylamino)methylideneamino)imidazole-4-carboxamide isomerase, partial [Firmicutes bacterium]|nr:1-(5-phosphoribosyl)-5-((5-phosphoribosylamino)methylideneamino)imidazole-4-carboxamide isomerase [Bacillota bacterium]
MQIYPAIDIIDGKAVRLTQGKFDNVEVFNDDPVSAAENWIKKGATYIHLVDLDGARYGKSFVIDIIKNIRAKFDVPIETGGGVRTMEAIDNRIESGA